LDSRERSEVRNIFKQKKKREVKKGLRLVIQKTSQRKINPFKEDTAFCFTSYQAGKKPASRVEDEKDTHGGKAHYSIRSDPRWRNLELRAALESESTGALQRENLRISHEKELQFLQRGGPCFEHRPS